MKNKIIATVSILVVVGLLIFGIANVFNSEAKATQKNIELAQKTIVELKKLPEYKDVKQKNWNDIIDILKQSKDSEEFESNYDWYLKGSLEKYDEEKKLGLISYKTLEDKIKNKDEFVVVYSQSRCPHCANLKNSGFKSYMEDQIGKGKHIYTVNLNIEQQGWTDTKVWDKTKDESHTESNNIAIPGTPAIGYYKDGKFVKGFVSEKSTEVVAWLNKIGFGK